MAGSDTFRSFRQSLHNFSLMCGTAEKELIFSSYCGGGGGGGTIATALHYLFNGSGSSSRLALLLKRTPGAFIQIRMRERRGNKKRSPPPRCSYSTAITRALASHYGLIRTEQVGGLSSLLKGPWTSKREKKNKY
jgi:hypothetical protein